jgi:hypothetical protein
MERPRDQPMMARGPGSASDLDQLTDATVSRAFSDKCETVIGSKNALNF